MAQDARQEVYAIKDNLTIWFKIEYPPDNGRFVLLSFITGGGESVVLPGYFKDGEYRSSSGTCLHSVYAWAELPVSPKMKG